MTVSAQYDFKLIVTETPALALDLAANPDIIHQITGDSGTLNASSNVTAAAVISDAVTLSAGALTINLTSYSRTTLAPAVDFTGTKVKLWKFKALSTNTQTVTISGGASNGYLLFGTAGNCILAPGEVRYGYAPATAPTVSSTLKNIDFASSQQDAGVSFILVA